MSVSTALVITNWTTCLIHESKVDNARESMSTVVILVNSRTNLAVSVNATIHQLTEEHHDLLLGDAADSLPLQQITPQHQSLVLNWSILGSGVPSMAELEAP